MKPDDRLWKAYRESLLSELERLSALINSLKEKYSLQNLTALKKAAHRLGGNASVFGYKDAAEVCQELEWELISKEKNYNLEDPLPNWFVGLDDYYRKIEKGFLIKDMDEKEQTLTSKGKEKKAVVIVDDDEDIIKLLDYEFRGLGFVVVSFQNGTDAQTYLLNKENLDNTSLLILDRILPDMDGLDILTKIGNEYPGHCPVLILSALVSEGDIILGLQGGAVDYVTKPFSIFLLMQKALNLLKM